MSELKNCRICNEEKPLEAFEIDSRCDGLYTTRCKECKYKTQDKAVRAFQHLQEKATKNGNEVEVTLNEIKALFMAFDGTCIYCGAQEQVDGPVFHLEHVVPRIQGGRDHISNLVISCPTCNYKKGSKPVVGFYFDEENFKDKNFTDLIHYISLSSGQPINAYVNSLVEDYSVYEIRKMYTEMEREFQKKEGKGELDNGAN
jgi:5-methylcytosine-specific restriction endonuclease McrA